MASSLLLVFVFCFVTTLGGIQGQDLYQDEDGFPLDETRLFRPHPFIRHPVAAGAVVAHNINNQPNFGPVYHRPISSHVSPYPARYYRTNEVGNTQDELEGRGIGLALAGAALVGYTGYQAGKYDRYNYNYPVGYVGPNAVVRHTPGGAVIVRTG